MGFKWGFNGFSMGFNGIWWGIYLDWTWCILRFNRRNGNLELSLDVITNHFKVIKWWCNWNISETVILTSRHFPSLEWWFTWGNNPQMPVWQQIFSVYTGLIIIDLIQPEWMDRSVPAHHVSMLNLFGQNCVFWVGIVIHNALVIKGRVSGPFGGFLPPLWNLVEESLANKAS